jgi:hypothetical protein
VSLKKASRKKQIQVAVGISWFQLNFYCERMDNMRAGEDTKIQRIYSTRNFEAGKPVQKLTL